VTLARALLSLGLLGAVATSAPAQAPAGPGYRWAFTGVEFAACVDFLVEPTLASRQLIPGYQVVPAASFGPLAPVLRREIEGDTIDAAWVPSQVCVIEAPQVTVGNNRLTPEGKMGGQEVVGYWAIAARRIEGQPRADQWFVARLWTNDWRVEKQTDREYIPVDMFKRSLVPIPESNRHRYEIKVGKTTLSWDGEMAGRDSTPASSPAPSSLIFQGSRSIQWTATVSSQPGWRRDLPGLFRVVGNDDLAVALRASPIRMFGPMYWGGDAQVEFTR
jgi:hypothetical protein